ncbi:hypothetical protein PMI04_000945 [Sphingobium sp. AP49]|uniref:hypothetical protein n=1 Tax=Sphingobium sp. AP49 TaxID=1144307 RepID=UPI00026EDAD9|nr:hypothetical protein [Sphingobium sp. AP49]WHO39200.1 hypothetical protein PMI04_000945 [Sphingobium sp. AP49]
MSSSAPSSRQALANPAWLAHRYDERQDSFHLVEADRQTRAKATFLTDEHLAPGPPMVIQRTEALALAPAPSPVHFIFHSAYCCSTLLARALDLPGKATTLKEPVLLNDMVGWRHRGGDGKRIAMVMDQGLRLLARPFAAGESVIMKPSNVVNGLIPAMMAMRPDARALFLHAPLEQYLSSIARKGLWSRRWARELLVKQMRDGSIPFGFEQHDYLELTDLQAAAVGWLAQQALFARLLREYGPARARSLDSEALMQDPRRTMVALVAHFDLPLSNADMDAMLTGPAFATDSKTGDAFGAERRSQDRQTAMAVHGEEIGMVLRWAEEIAVRFQVPMQLPHPLAA